MTSSRLGALAVAAVVAALALTVAVTDRDGTEDAPGPEPTTSSSATTTTEADGDDLSTAIWPFAGADATFDDPVALARTFATTFLGFATPTVGELREGDARSGEIDVRPEPAGPATTVLVRRIGPADRWYVLAASTADIELDSPAAGDEIGSPVEVSGRARAFEGVVRVEVRADGDVGALGTTTVVGGGDVLRPFRGSVSFETPGAALGSVVLFTRSARDVEVWQATAIRVRLRSTDAAAASCGTFRPPRPAPGSDEMEISIFFTCGDDGSSTLAVHRLVPRATGVLRASLDALVRGPSATERAVGISSWFSGATTGMVRSVDIDSGHAVVDFDDLRPVIPNASASAGSELLLSQLDATVFQFPSVESVEYRIGGSCETLTEWLQIGGCDARTRPPSQD